MRGPAVLDGGVVATLAEDQESAWARRGKGRGKQDEAADLTTPGNSSPPNSFPFRNLSANRRKISQRFERYTAAESRGHP